MQSIKGIGRVSHAITGNEPASAKIHGKPTKMQICAKARPKHILGCRGDQELLDIGFIHDTSVDEIPWIIKMRARILTFKHKFEHAPVQAKTNASALFNLRVRPA